MIKNTPTSKRHSEFVAHFLMRITLAALGSVAALSQSGCDKPAPPSVAQTQSSPIDRVADNPQSSLGKSAAAARDAANAAQLRQSEASALADSLSGRTGGAVGGDERTVKVSGVEFRAPAGWSSIPPQNRMQSAAYLIGEATGGGQMGGQDTVCVWLAGIGGSVEQNLDRWRGQVKNPATNQPAESKVETRTIAGMRVTLVSMSGTYSSMVGGAATPIPGTGFRGAIVEAPSGAVFVRLTGPSDKVASASKDFDAMIAGMTRP
jgi:hypothetical protein